MTHPWSSTKTLKGPSPTTKSVVWITISKKFLRSIKLLISKCKLTVYVDAMETVKANASPVAFNVMYDSYDDDVDGSGEEDYY